MSLVHPYEDEIYSYPEMTRLEEKAWALYCKESAGMISAKDFWQQLPLETRQHYLKKVKYD